MAVIPIFIDVEYSDLNRKEVISASLVLTNGDHFYYEVEKQYDPNNYHKFLQGKVFPKLWKGSRPEGYMGNYFYGSYYDVCTQIYKDILYAYSVLSNGDNKQKLQIWCEDSFIILPIIRKAMSVAKDKTVQFDVMCCRDFIDVKCILHANNKTVKNLLGQSYRYTTQFGVHHALGDALIIKACYLALYEKSLNTLI